MEQKLLLLRHCGLVAVEAVNDHSFDLSRVNLFSHAMRDAMLLPTFLFIAGFIAVMFYERPQHAGFGG